MAKGTGWIELDYEKKKAFTTKKVGTEYKPVELGTEEATVLLQKHKQGIYAVGHSCSYGVTAFIMKRRPDGIWVGYQAGEAPYPKERKYVLGKSQEITYARITQVWEYFQGEKKKLNVLESEEVASRLVPRIEKLMQGYLGLDGIKAALVISRVGLKGYQGILHLAVGEFSDNAIKYILNQASTIRGDCPKEPQELKILSEKIYSLVFEIGYNNFLVCLFSSSVDAHSPPKCAVYLLQDLRRLSLKSRFNPENKQWWKVWYLPEKK